MDSSLLEERKKGKFCELNKSIATFSLGFSLKLQVVQLFESMSMKEFLVDVGFLQTIKVIYAKLKSGHLVCFKLFSDCKPFASSPSLTTLEC